MNAEKALGILAAAVWLFGATGAGAFDVTALGPQDRAALQEMLEFGRSNQERPLPSGRSVTIVQTDLEPRVCRHFVIESSGAQQRGVGCRTGQGAWDLAGSANATAGTGAAPPRPRQAAALSPPPPPPPPAARSSAAAPAPGRRTVNLRDLPLDLAAPQGAARQDAAPQDAAPRGAAPLARAAAATPQPVAGAPYTPPLPRRRPVVAQATDTASDVSVAVSAGTAVIPESVADIPLPPRRPGSGAAVVAAVPASPSVAAPLAAPGETPPDIPLPRRRPGTATARAPDRREPDRRVIC